MARKMIFWKKNGDVRGRRVLRHGSRHALTASTVEGKGVTARVAGQGRSGADDLFETFAWSWKNKRVWGPVDAAGIGTGSLLFGQKIK
jgi:hypothetical protein